jgi:uncharacterized heparinase superfamily protein
MLLAFFRFARTVKYLKYSQIYWRIYYKFTNYSPSDLKAPPRAVLSDNFNSIILKKGVMIGPKEFFLLNLSGNLEDLGWEGSERSRLWRYNQHYFDDLNSISSNKRLDWHKDLIEDWISKNSPTKGTGWEPYPNSLSIVNWIKWDLRFGELSQKAVQVLAIKARFLMLRLERHLLGNHIFANGKALIFAGAYFDGPEADTWLKMGLNILKVELSEQILKDGGHFELSPMYHSIILEDLIDILNICRSYGDRIPNEYNVEQDRWILLIQKMVFWLKSMIHPDGEIAFFNDATFGVAAVPEEIFNYVSRMNISHKTQLKPFGLMVDTGYFRAQKGNALLIGDIGKVGADYIPGHAHADTLSFEMSLNKKRVFVNSGVSKYGSDEERLRQRSTPAHSTLVINGENSSEVWSGFRVGRRALPENIKIMNDKEGETQIIAQHNGFSHLCGHPTHQRDWKLREGKLTIMDTIYGSGTHRLDVFFHLCVNMKATDLGNNCLIIANNREKQIGKMTFTGGIINILPSKWFPSFGVFQRTQCIHVSQTVTLPHQILTKFEW